MSAQPPVKDFNGLGISKGLLKAIDRLKFTEPTPIQEEAIPAGIEGKDIIAIAQTGTGKTLAFGVPMIQRLAKSKRGMGLVVVPTRELAVQVDESIQSVGRSQGLRTAVLIGGASMIHQIRDLKKNPRIIIATPGRLLDHLERRTLKLSNIEMVVLDEADRMLDMGFAPDIKKIFKAIPKERQTMLFSATIPKEIIAIAQRQMVDPIQIEIDRSGTAAEKVDQEMFFIDKHAKSRLLEVQLNQHDGPVLVFTRTKRGASKLTRKVNNMGYKSAEIHSDRSLAQRRQALEGFKKGKYRVLVATDIAARGIDVSGIELVVNYDLPSNSEDYVHRIGRTGRAGLAGRAISFATKDQRKDVKSIERLLQTTLPVSSIPHLPKERTILRKDRVSEESESQSKFRKPRRSRFTKRNSNQVQSSKRGGFKKRKRIKNNTKKASLN